MQPGIKEIFSKLWKKYFDGAGLPVAFYYSDDARGMKVGPPPKGRRCVMVDLVKARGGTPLCLDGSSFGCAGAKRYLGFSGTLRPNFEYFLSYGIPGKLQGERYKKTPELVREMLANSPEMKAPARYVILKRWDLLDDSERPDVVIFFASPDVLSGLFTLSSFERADTEGVIAPFGAGCGSIFLRPYLEGKSRNPKCVIGMFDVTARPYVEPDVLTFSAPMKLFERMAGNMEESFLITSSWRKVQRRIAG